MPEFSSIRIGPIMSRKIGLKSRPTYVSFCWRRQILCVWRLKLAMYCQELFLRCYNKSSSLCFQFDVTNYVSFSVGFVAKIWLRLRRAGRFETGVCHRVWSHSAKRVARRGWSRWTNLGLFRFVFASFDSHVSWTVTYSRRACNVE